MHTFIEKSLDRKARKLSLLTLCFAEEQTRGNGTAWGNAVTRELQRRRVRRANYIIREHGIIQ